MSGERMFNDEQEGHMRMLANLPKEAKCDCGWDRRGWCFGACLGYAEKGGYVRPERTSTDEPVSDA